MYIFGIPFSIDFSVPIRAGYDLTANAEAQMEVTANGRGTIDYGVRYTSEAGMQWISNYTFDHSGGIQSMGYDIDATLQLYLMPSIAMSVDHIGGPTLGFKPFLEFGASAKSQSTCIAHGGFTASLNWGLQVSIGAKFHVDLPMVHWQKTFNNTGIYSIKRPIITGCVGESSQTQNNGRKLLGSDPTPAPTPDPTNTPTVPQCGTTQWTEWGPCSEPCGGGVQTHTREIYSYEYEASCDTPKLSETQQCNPQSCPKSTPKDCSMSSWGDYGPCSRGCQGGIQQRARSVLKAPAQDGAACPSSEETHSCNQLWCGDSPPEPPQPSTHIIGHNQEQQNACFDSDSWKTMPGTTW